jgi:hypothetical protein
MPCGLSHRWMDGIDYLYSESISPEPKAEESRERQLQRLEWSRNGIVASVVANLDEGQTCIPPVPGTEHTSDSSADGVR